MDMESLERRYELIKNRDPELFEYLSSKIIEEKETTVQPIEEETDITEVKPIKDEKDLSIAFKKKINIVLELMKVLSGQEDVRSRLDPITNPKNWKTTTVLTRGEVTMIHAFIIFSKQSPEECNTMVDWCFEYCQLKLSEGGTGIEKGIELARTFQQVSRSISSFMETPDINKPTQGVKERD